MQPIFALSLDSGAVTAKRMASAAGVDMYQIWHIWGYYKELITFDVSLHTPISKLPFAFPAVWCNDRSLTRDIKTHRKRVAPWSTPTQV